jgi:hypothetical protein
VRRAAISHQPSAISHQPSAISHQGSQMRGCLPFGTLPPLSPNIVVINIRDVISINKLGGLVLAGSGFGCSTGWVFKERREWLGRRLKAGVSGDGAHFVPGQSRSIFAGRAATVGDCGHEGLVMKKVPSARYPVTTHRDRHWGQREGDARIEVVKPQCQRHQN